MSAGRQRRDHEAFQVDCAGLARGESPEPIVFVLFGATGDLARSQLIPALFALHRRGLSPEQFAIVGVARGEGSDRSFREAARASVVAADGSPPAEWRGFAERLSYVDVGSRDEARSSYERLRSEIDDARRRQSIDGGSLLFHLAVPPAAYAEIVENLSAVGLLDVNGLSARVIVEKPFGHDRRSARELDRRMLAVLDEERIYRIDHYLGKETVQNLLVFRFANPSFEPVWDRRYIDHVQITAAEPEGIGSRAGYYEQAGAVRDMLQSHLLQLLCMTAMEPPRRYAAQDLRNESVKVLEAIVPPERAGRDWAVGQYGPGRVAGEPVAGYRDERGVDAGSAVPTYAALRLRLQNPRWAGVPFYLRTGKRLPRKCTEITVQFRDVPHLLFPLTGDAERRTENASFLTFRLQPDEGILHSFLAKQPGPGICLRPVRMNFVYDRAFDIEQPPGAYEWLLHDAMLGDPTLFPRSDWIGRAWSTVEPLLDADAEPEPYAAGRWGPESARRLIEQDGRHWRPGPATAQRPEPANK
jgi:glucose-6-phosphate 1-dehydrogenase